MNAVACSAVRFVKKLGFKLAQKSPVFMLVGGAAFLVGGTVYSIAKSDKAHDILDKLQNDLEQIRKDEETADKRHNPEDWYPQENRKKDRRKAYRTMFKSMAKLYFPVVVLELIGVLLISGSHIMMTKKCAALGSSLAAVTGQFNTYRKRVEDKYGKEAEEAIFYGFQDHEVVKTVTGPDGQEQTETKTVRTADPCTPYARFIDPCSAMWNKNPHYTLENIVNQQRIANNLLRTYGFLSINDVYKLLNVPLIEGWEGNNIGWVYDKGKEDKISFGIYEANREATRRFVNGYEDCVLLDFNVDGDLNQYLGKGKRYGKEIIAPARL